MTIEKSLLALQGTMLHALTSSMPLEQTMYMLCSEVERLAPEVRCCLIRLEGQLMRPLAAPSMPEIYNAALNGFAIGPHVGACGVSMTYGRSVLTTDIATDPNWVPLKHLVLPLGLGVCWSHPIKARDGKILGSMAFYYQPGERPTEFHHQLVESCISLCALAFQHEAAQQSIQQHAYFDSLTNLPNRSMLNREIQQTLTDCARDDAEFSLLFIDLDNLKPINDSLGHVVGDRVLQHAAQRLRSQMHGSGVIGRLGGDEFLAVVRHSDSVDANEIAQRLIESFKEPLELSSINGQELRLGLSIGIATYPRDGIQTDTLIHHADMAMYQAKTNGANQITCFSALPPEKLEPVEAAPPPTAVTAPVAEPVETTHEEPSPVYGNEVWAAMTQLSAAIKPKVGAIVEQFYKQIPLIPSASRLAANLSPKEIDTHKIRLTEAILLLCSPDLDQARHEELALKTGEVHAILGLTPGSLIKSNSVLSALVHSHVDAQANAHALMIFGQRLLRDMTWQMVSARQMQIQCGAILSKLTELAWDARSYTELVSSTAETLNTLSGVAGCGFLRSDPKSVFQVEMVSGIGMAEFYNEVMQLQLSWVAGGKQASMPSSPSTWAWSSQEISRCFNFSTDERMIPWESALNKRGLRSCIAIPLVAPKEQVTTSVLCVYSKLPGGFSSPEQDAFFVQVQALLVLGINRLRAWRIAAQAIPFFIRQRWQGLLKTSGLEMYYQPIVDFRKAKTVKVEALARLRDEQRILAPGEFFSALSPKDFLLLYENGLEQALRQRQKWAQHGLDLMLSINLPTVALEDDLYVDITQRILRRHNCQPGDLSLEILETEEVAPGVDLLRILHQYKKIGVCLSEDDLGSGYSTLARMHKMPFDAIKIDRSLISEVETAPYNTLCLIYQLTKLGHSLGKAVIVEGIESTDLLDACSILGVDGAQGYAIAKPMSSVDLISWATKPLAWTSNTQSNHLTLLANILVWEDSWHALDRISEPRSEERANLAHSLEKIITDKCFPLPDSYAIAKQDLLQSITLSGLRSDHYRQARERMVALLNTP